jgi:hypothetical protein
MNTFAINLITLANVIVTISWFKGIHGGNLFAIGVVLTLATFNVMEKEIMSISRILFPKLSDPTMGLFVACLFTQTYLLFQFSWTVLLAYILAGIVVSPYMFKRIFG